jgi:hypothetical protein
MSKRREKFRGKRRTVEPLSAERQLSREGQLASDVLRAVATYTKASNASPSSKDADDVERILRWVNATFRAELRGQKGGFCGTWGSLGDE